MKSKKVNFNWVVDLIVVMLLVVVYQYFNARNWGVILMIGFFLGMIFNDFPQFLKNTYPKEVIK
jgi:hypothetical protein